MRIADQDIAKMTTMTVPRTRHTKQPGRTLSLLITCRTCGREYASIQAFCREYGECTAPALITGRKGGRHA